MYIFKLWNGKQDANGRFIIILGVLEGKQILLDNLYAPNAFAYQQQFFHKMIKILKPYEDIQNWILTGDFNGVM